MLVLNTLNMDLRWSLNNQKFTIMKTTILYLSMLLLILCLPFMGNVTTIVWLWEDLPWVPFLLVLASLLCIATYLYKKERVGEGH
jgi:hypothetical protein